MNTSLQVIIFVTAVLNLIAISLSIYKKKHNLALGLAFLEVILVYLSTQV